MEYNNSKKIRQHLPKLIEITKCSNVFLAYFTSEDIFCKSDDEKIKLEQRNFGDTAAASKFYDLILTKRGSFEILLHALRETKQSGALSVLVDVNDAGNKGVENSALKFVKIPDYMEEFAKDDDKSILIVTSEDCEITCEWILETTQNCKLFRAGNINELDSLGKDYVAVVNVGENLDTLHFLAKNYDKKAVLVTSISLDDESLLTLNTSTNKCKFVHDNIQWKDLALAEKEKILTGLKESLKIDGKYLTDVLEQVDTKHIVNLIRGSFPLPHELFSETIPNLISYYIPRTLVTRNILSKKLLFSPASSNSVKIEDVFLFSNTERHVLSQFAGRNLTDTSGNLLHNKKIHTSFVILEQENHYNNICSLLSNNFFHHLKYDGNDFIWIKSNGNISHIQTFVSSNQSNIYETDFLSEILNQEQKYPICISDSPGMGKSILLAHLASQLENLHDNGIVVFAVISELVRSIRNKCDTNTLATATVLATFDHVSKSKLGHVYLKANTSYIRELFLDGLDEIDADEMDFALSCIKEIQLRFKDTRIWITTRPHIFQTLERQLNVLGYNIAPFSDKDQVNFLESFWSSRMDKKHGSEILTDFAQHILTNLKFSQNVSNQGREENIKHFDDSSVSYDSWEDYDRFSEENSTKSTVVVYDIAGVPLQCLLVGEVYEEGAKLAVQNTIKEKVVVNYDIRSIPDLYSKMIDKKFLNFKEKYDDYNLGYSEIETAHMQVSIQLLFPDNLGHYLGYLSHGLSMQQIFDVGIIESQSVLSTPRFIHRTFAEYFVAKFIAKLLFKSKTIELVEFLAKEIFKTTDYDYQIQGFDLCTLKFEQIVIVRFLNNFLENLNLSRPIHTIEDSEILTQVLTASLHHNFENIFHYFLNGAASQPQFDFDFFNNKALAEAACWAKIPLLKTVVVKYSTTRNTPINEVQILNHVYGNEWYHRRFGRRLGRRCGSDEFDDYLDSNDDFFSSDVDDDFCVIRYLDSENNDKTSEVEETDIDVMANKSFTSSLTLLHIGVHRDDFATVEFLLTNYFQDSVRQNIASKYDQILHICVKHSVNNSDWKIAEQIQIINILGNINTSLFIMENRESLPN